MATKKKNKPIVFLVKKFGRWILFFAVFFTIIFFFMLFDAVAGGIASLFHDKKKEPTLWQSTKTMVHKIAVVGIFVSLAVIFAIFAISTPIAIAGIAFAVVALTLAVIGVWPLFAKEKKYPNLLPNQ